MNPFACPREKEVAESLRLGQWPEGVAADLREHVSGCRVCSDLALVTKAFQGARNVTAPAAPMQSPGVLWWRAQLRRRNAAIERVSQPIIGAQIFAFAITILVGVGALAWAMRNGFHLTAWVASFLAPLHLDALLPASWTGLSGSFILLLPILATLVLVSGVVVYLTSEKQ